ncbi:MAG: hypothetical protein Q7R93_00050 [bacterium]|nr:hypothetical protein [bacterium]
MKPQKGDFEFWPFQTGSNGMGLALQFILFPIASILPEVSVKSAISGTELTVWCNSTFRHPTEAEARAFSERFSQRLGDRQVVFPLLEATEEAKLLVRLPHYRHKRLSDGSNLPESKCRCVPLHFLFTDTSWAAFIKKE